MNSLALIHIANRKLAFPHNHVHAIERCSNKETRIRMSGVEWQLQSLENDFSLRSQVLDSEPFAICFKRYPIALRCNKVDSVDGSNFTPLPSIMKNWGGCVQGFIHNQGELIFVVDIDSLLQRGEVQCNGTHGA